MYSSKEYANVIEYDPIETRKDAKKIGMLVFP